MDSLDHFTRGPFWMMTFTWLILQNNGTLRSFYLSHLWYVSNLNLLTGVNCWKPWAGQKPADITELGETAVIMTVILYEHDKAQCLTPWHNGHHGEKRVFFCLSLQKVLISCLSPQELPYSGLFFNTLQPTDEVNISKKLSAGVPWPSSVCTVGFVALASS